MIKAKLLTDEQGFTGVDAPWAEGQRRIRWRVLPNAYSQVSLQDETGVVSIPRTRGEPTTARKVRDLYSSLVDHAIAVSKPPLTASLATHAQLRHLVLATACAESKGNPSAERYEQHINDWSFGLMQTLTAAAASVLDDEPVKPAIPQGGNVERWRKFLCTPANSLMAGTDLYLTVLASEPRYFRGGALDPVLAYATYNAGSARLSKNTPLGLVYYTDKATGADAMLSFLRWYNDVAVALAELG